MDHESSEEESPLALNKNMVNIKDYSQEQQSQHEQDSPFDELEQILGQDQNRQSRDEYLLTQKIKQLEQKCNTMKVSNSCMQIKIKDLSQDIKDYQKFMVDDPSESGLIEALQKLIAEFKSSFQDFRSKQMRTNQDKDSEILRLRQELEKSNQQRRLLQQQKIELQQSNNDISRTNQNLIQEIQKLQGQLVQNRSEINSSRSYRFNSRRDNGFESQIQAELEVLIEKLMAQLQLERNQKRRFNDQIKRMQREMMILEKEITSKNNKIYQLEMSCLKQNRSPKTNPSFVTSFKNGKQSREIDSDRTKNSLKTISLLQLLNDDELTDRERLIISSKIIDFYSRKANSKDYSSYELENLLICNYNKSNPALISIRKDANSQATKESTQEKMLINLGEILDILLGEYLNEIKEEDSGEEYLLNLINEILSNKNVNINDIYVIKQLIEDCLRSRK